MGVVQQRELFNNYSEQRELFNNGSCSKSKNNNVDLDTVICIGPLVEWHLYRTTY